jgi:hypothetical protein
VLEVFAQRLDVALHPRARLRALHRHRRPFAGGDLDHLVDEPDPPFRHRALLDDHVRHVQVDDLVDLRPPLVDALLGVFEDVDQAAAPEPAGDSPPVEVADA